MATPSEHHGEDITVGFEYKALFQAHGPPLSDNEAYQAVAESIRMVGPPAHPIHHIDQESKFWATHWIVKRANSVKSTTKEENGMIPVEITSPIFSTRQEFTVVSRVLSKLKETFRVNYTCDVHVHIGHTDRPIPLLILKRLAILLWLAEPILRSVRNPKSPNYTNKYTWGAEMRIHSRLVTTAPVVATHNLYQYLDISCQPSVLSRQLETIWLVERTTELGRLLSGSEDQYRRLGFNFSAFGEEDERAQKSPKTVEFRILEGTLDENLVVAWVHICCRWMELAMEEQLFKVIASYLIQYESDGSGPDHRFSRLMEQIGVSKDMYGDFVRKIQKDRDI